VDQKNQASTSSARTITREKEDKVCRIFVLRVNSGNSQAQSDGEEYDEEPSNFHGQAQLKPSCPTEAGVVWRNTSSCDQRLMTS
jgi:hypothetical protein